MTVSYHYKALTLLSYFLGNRDRSVNFVYIFPLNCQAIDQPFSPFVPQNSKISFLAFRWDPDDEGWVIQLPTGPSRAAVSAVFIEDKKVNCN